MRIIELKTWPSFFTALISGKKSFEVRFNDRSFSEGDILCLREFESNSYTGRQLFFEVTFILDLHAFLLSVSDKKLDVIMADDLTLGYVVLGIKRISG